MHEMGIAQEIVTIVQQELDARPGACVTGIGLRIGELSGVDPASLTFCLDCLRKDSPLEPAELRIERTAADELDVAFVEMEVP